MTEDYSKDFFKEQLKELKEQQKEIQERIEHLEKAWKEKSSSAQKISFEELSSSKPEPESIAPVRKEVSVEQVNQVVPSQVKVEKSEKVKTADMELNFGRHWLNKIGVVVFTLGIGFLISYTFKYFTPLLKISFGYLVCALLFSLGYQFEKKEKLMHFGRVLLGGAWAMTYFTTYAMHHFEASRILQSQIIDIGLLSLVAGGMILHSMKYKSETMTSMAIFVAYLTSTLGAITNFTFFSCLLLSVVILFLAYRYQWMKILFLGVGLTYFVHFFWIIPNIDNTFFPTLAWGDLSPSMSRTSLSLVFLSAYWLVFFLGLHLIRTKEVLQMRKIAVANFLNFLLFYAMAYQPILDLYYAQRFSIIFGLGLIYLVFAVVMKSLGRGKVYVSDLVIGIMVVTLSIPLKFLPSTTLMIWVLEIPFLLVASFLFKEKILRFMSYFVSILFFLRLSFLCVFPESHLANVQLFGFDLAWYEFMYLVAAISFGFCGIYGEIVRRREGLPVVDIFFNHVFSVLSFFYLTSFVWLVLKKNYLTFGLILEFFILYAVSYLFGLRRLRVYGYILLPFILVRNLFVDNLDALYSQKWILLGIEVLAFYAIYVFNRYLLKQEEKGAVRWQLIPLVNLPHTAESYCLLVCNLLLILGLIYKYIAWQWISLGLGIAGVCIVSGGIIDKDKVLRISGLLFFGLTLIRVILIDLSDVDMIFKIITFIAIGGIFLVVSFIYNNYIGDEKSIKKKESEDNKR